MLDQGWGHIYPEFFGQVGLVSAMGGLAFPKENGHFLMGKSSNNIYKWAMASMAMLNNHRVYIYIHNIQLYINGGFRMAGGTPSSHPLMGFSMKSTIHFGSFWGTPYFRRNSICFDHVVGLWQLSIMIVSD